MRVFEPGEFAPGGRVNKADCPGAGFHSEDATVLGKRRLTPAGSGPFTPVGDVPQPATPVRRSEPPAVGAECDHIAIATRIRKQLADQTSIRGIPDFDAA